MAGRFPRPSRIPCIYGYNGYPGDGVAKGWLRASHRELEPFRGRPERPFHTHRAILRIEPGQPTELSVEIWPSSTYFEAGSELTVEIVGHDADRYPALRHVSANRGTHTVHTGGSTASALVARLIPLSNPSSWPSRRVGPLARSSARMTADTQLPSAVSAPT